jgi:hypothetical protein
VDKDVRQAIDALNTRVDELQAKLQDALDFIDAWKAHKAESMSPDPAPDDAELPAEGDQPVAADEPTDPEEETGDHVEHFGR